MAGHALRYGTDWYLRTPTGAWVLAASGLRAGQDVPTRERRAVDEGLAVVLEDLWQVRDRLPAHIRRGLVVEVPATREQVEEAEARRPSRATLDARAAARAERTRRG